MQEQVLLKTGTIPCPETPQKMPVQIVRNTIDGMDASVSDPNLMSFTKIFSFVYSSINTAAPTPSGAATSTAITVTITVETIIGAIPPDLPESMGFANRNSRFTTGSPLISM